MTAFFGIQAAARPADLAWTTHHASPAANHGENSKLGELLAGAGLRPVTPPSPASDFDLPRLDGGRGSLSDYRGNWVVLTFWATWCEPCRMEMPSLERLHRDRADQGLSVVGVSIDAVRAPIGAFVEQLGLSFPMFWDERGDATSVYRATSIPLSYLIDPAGRIAGISRGARDWSELGGVLDAVLAAVPPDAGAQAVYGSGLVELPSTLNPPTAELALSDPKPQVGRTFYLHVDLHWAGTFEDYLPHPPEVLLPEGIEEERVTASTSSRAGSNVVSYRLALRAHEPGTYALGPVELRYTPRLESTPVASRVSGPTVVVGRRTIAGFNPSTLLLGAGGVAFAGLLGFVVARRWRAAAQSRASTAGTSYDRLCARLEEARSRRLLGDAAGFVVELADIQAELGDSGGEPDPVWQKLAEGARYGGQAPPDEELDRLQRLVERRLESLRPDPEETARQGLRLREEMQRPSRPEGVRTEEKEEK